LEFLAGQPWPGNVRQLENIVRQAMLAARPFAIGVDHVREALARSFRPDPRLGAGHGAYVADLLDRAERGEIEEGAYWRMITDLEPELFKQAIQKAGGNQAKAARWLGITRLKMREKLSELGLGQGSATTTERESPEG
jgi:DNA-binding NtrC family response regulator